MVRKVSVLFSIAFQLLAFRLQAVQPSAVNNNNQRVKGAAADPNEDPRGRGGSEGVGGLGGQGWPFGGQEGGMFMPFPQGLAPDGTRYKTDYRCEGQNMTVSCTEDDGQTIEVVRGNFGRFSIAICNRHGQTDWSVNCMAPETTQILKKRCDGLKTCIIPVLSSQFPDACPNTLKYLEIHYACRNSDSSAPKSKIPPWLVQQQQQQQQMDLSSQRKWTELAAKENLIKDSSDGTVPSSQGGIAPPNQPRKPILVTEKAVKVTEVASQPTSEVAPRVPITTPRPKEEVEVGRKKEEEAFSDVKVAEEEEETSEDVREHEDYSTPSSSNINVSTRPHQSSFNPTSWCPPTTSRQLQWDWTQAGKEVVQPCPIGATGHARWACALGGEGGLNGQQQVVQWASPLPDMSSCKSVAMSNLEAQVRKEDPENVLVSALAYLTRTKSLYGGDLETAVATMRTVASRIQYRLQQSDAGAFHNKESHIRQVLQNVFRSANNMLEGSNRQAWMDLTVDGQMKVATQLLLAVEENAFLLAGVMNEPNEVLESSDILTMSISVLDVSANPRLSFPSRTNGNLLYVDDSIQLSPRDLRENSQGEVAEAVFFSFANLHEILGGAKMHLREGTRTKGLSLNSRIISASLARAGRHTELSEPVRVTLRHLDTNMTDPVCVFWDLEDHGWSDVGCSVASSNSTETVCMCDHLTNFAVVMRPRVVGGGVGAFFEGVRERMDVVGSVLAAVVVFAALLVGMKCRHKVADLSCCCCRPNDLHKSQSFYTGLSQHQLSGHSSSNSSSAASASGVKGGAAGNGSAGSRALLINNSLRAQSQYVLSTQHMQPGTVRVTPQGSALLPPGHPLTKPRPHITLNPYSTQLVDNINLMMGNTKGSSLLSEQQQRSMSPQLMSLTQSMQRRQQQLESGNEAGYMPQQQEEVVYRAVSPHGHVYWEIDPASVSNYMLVNQMAANNGAAGNGVAANSYFAQHDPLASAAHLDEAFCRASPSSRFAQQNNSFHERHPLLKDNSSSLNPSNNLRSSSSMEFPDLKQQQQPNGGGVHSTFVRTGAGRYNRNNSRTLDRSTRSEVNNSVVPEQLQTQVQIRDIRPIQVSVNSEYIEAKIRTLRKNNNNNVSKS